MGLNCVIRFVASKLASHKRQPNVESYINFGYGFVAGVNEAQGGW